MLGAFVRKGEIFLANELFKEMKSKDVVSWNTILHGYVKFGQTENARKVFEKMPSRDSVSWNTMISGFARCGQIDNALELFEEMPDKNVVSWNSVISGLMDNGEVDRAMEMWRRMPFRDSATLSGVVSGLVRNGLLEEAERALRESGEENLDACNTLIAGFGRAGQVKDALQLFERIPGGDGKCFRRNVVSWNSMIMGYVKAGKISEARKLFDEMPERDSFSWNTMISGYIQTGELERALVLLKNMPDPEERTWNLMISGFSQSRNVEEARRCFEMMPFRNTISWNTIITSYEQSGDYVEPMNLLSRMLASGEHPPDKHTLSAALGACAGLASLHHGMQVHQILTKRFIPDTPISNALITMYARCGNLSNAEQAFTEMPTRRDVVSWNAVISGYAQHGRAEEALKLFSLMVIETPPTHITFISILHACCHGGLVEEGRRFFSAMTDEYKILPSMEHYAAIVDLLGRHGHLKEAVEVMVGMVVPPGRAVWGALLGACRVHKNVELARMAVAGLAAADPAGSAAYVLLCNMHASSGQWAEATEVRAAMELKGIRKQVGYSWIELAGSFHVFVAGDMSHPLACQILIAADCCSRAIKEEIRFNLPL